MNATEMKNIYCNILKISVFVFFFIVVGACGKDKEPIPEPTNAELIVGKWYITKTTTSDGAVQQPANDCEKKTCYEFSAEGVMNVNHFELDEVCKNTLSMTAQYTLTLDRRKLVVIGSDGVSNAFEIIRLNDKILEIEVGGGIIAEFEKR
ncbi:lipocalin family protein [Parapedobacter sp. SGR-10]|uniref:lipocalin family protein n=1 Tax=Parapedobacter sp. SGR-10 TaxID=2710879 RepID=UPI0013D4C7D0|nr:lipocalin family protein [Parapedobacter sp. SGR-10]NGF55534.1 lipocalin family protein [Parapedobacter sp. SGR-10]